MDKHFKCKKIVEKISSIGEEKQNTEILKLIKELFSLFGGPGIIYDFPIWKINEILEERYVKR